MVLIGSDFHPSWQQVSWLNRETGESGDQKLVHEAGAAEKFYKQFPAGSRIGMEATGNCQWFLELMAKLGHEVLVGDAAKIRASDSRQQKHDRRDARLLVQLLAERIGGYALNNSVPDSYAIQHNSPGLIVVDSPAAEPSIALRAVARELRAHVLAA